MAELSQTENTDNLIALWIFRYELIRDQELYEIFISKPPSSNQEIIAEAEGCIRSKEARLGRNKIRMVEIRGEHRGEGWQQVSAQKM